MAVKKKRAKKKKVTRKKRTPAQKRATTKLVARNKKRAKKRTKSVKRSAPKKRSTAKKVTRKKSTPVKKTRRKNTMAKRKVKRRKASPARKGDFVGTLMNGAIAGGGAIAGSMATQAISKVLNLTTAQQKNALGVGLSLAAAYLLPRFIAKDVARSVTDGMFAISMASLAQTALGKNLISLSGSLPITDYGLSAIEMPNISEGYEYPYGDVGAIEEPGMMFDDYEIGQEDFIVS